MTWLIVLLGLPFAVVGGTAGLVAGMIAAKRCEGVAGLLAIPVAMVLGGVGLPGVLLAVLLAVLRGA